MALCDYNTSCGFGGLTCLFITLCPFSPRFLTRQVLLHHPLPLIIAILHQYGSACGSTSLRGTQSRHTDGRERDDLPENGPRGAAGKAKR